MKPEASENPSVDVSNDKETPIQNKYSFWFMKRNQTNKSESYEKSIKLIDSFQTVESFWSVYAFMVRPDALPNSTDYHLFKSGIKPMWEDSANRKGGKWMVRLRKGITSRLWEELLLAIIGEQFDVGNEVCGAVLSIRYNEDVISLWNRNADNEEALYKLRDTLRRIFKLPQFVSMEYKRHDAALNDNTGVRTNTNVWRSNRNSNSNNGRNTPSGKERERGENRENRSGSSRGRDRRDGNVPPPSSSSSSRYNRDRGGDREERSWTRGQTVNRERVTREKANATGDGNVRNDTSTRNGADSWQVQR